MPYNNYYYTKISGNGPVFMIKHHLTMHIVNSPYKQIGSRPKQIHIRTVIVSMLCTMACECESCSSVFQFQFIFQDLHCRI